MTISKTKAVLLLCAALAVGWLAAKMTPPTKVLLRNDVIVNNAQFQPPNPARDGEVRGNILKGSECNLNWIKGGYAGVSCDFIVRREAVVDR